MILKSLGYLSAYDEYCAVYVERAYINRKMKIENRESGTGNWVLVPYLSNLLDNLKLSKSRTGNRELLPCSFSE